MRMLASSVLVMESFVMGFALLLAMKDHSSPALILGGVIAILCLLAPGLLKKKAGWILGWIPGTVHSADEFLYVDIVHCSTVGAEVV